MQRPNPGRSMPKKVERPARAVKQDPPSIATNTTAPYTFIPFAPTVLASSLWPTESTNFDPTTAFDRLLPGTHTGHLDIALTALSPLHVGPTENGAPFHWPSGNDERPRYGVPSFSLRGMIRATLSVLLGGGLGLVEADPLPVLERDPVRADADDPVGAKRHKTYKDRRGPGSSIGRQRVGLLFVDGAGSGHVVECAQFNRMVAGRDKTLVPSPKVPSVQWRVVVADLVAAAEDKRTALRELYGELIYVVWAWATVESVPRAVAFAVGRTAEQAERNALTPHRHEIVAPAQKATGLPDFVDSRWKPSTVPVGQPMILFPTNLANLDRAGQSTANANGAANCYLIAPPGSLLGAPITAPVSGPLPIGPEAPGRPHPLETLSRVLERHYWKNGITPAQRTEHGWPVFFDVKIHAGKPTVVRLGGSNGFPIAAEHTPADAVRNGSDGDTSWATKIADAVGDNNAVVGLFGAVDGRNQIAARIDVGHATVVGEPVPLSERKPVLLAPHIEAAHTRLDQHRELDRPTTYSIGTPKYRGREVYWHQGDWPASTDAGFDGGEQRWCDIVASKAQRQETEMGPGDRPDNASELGTWMAPLPIGTQLLARVHFTNLTGPELGAVLFALRFPTATSNTTFAHKLGGGQPLGLGSVSCTAELFLHTADRYASLAGDGLCADSGATFINEFLDALGWQATQATEDWIAESETGRRWPRHVAAWLRAARWQHRPTADRVAEMGVAEHKYRRPMLDVFDVAAATPTEQNPGSTWTR
ncbi:hypothetical protein ACGFIX_14440 [Nocardia salmonicida]|uniref:hypothetical protein n=1 Tax=Nocardia salmonicida TaxID=53431 RepID=UPI00371C0AC3